MKLLINREKIFLLYFSFFISFNACRSQDIFYCENAGAFDGNRTSITITCDYFYNFLTKTKDSVMQTTGDVNSKRAVKITAALKNKSPDGPVRYYLDDTVLLMSGYLKEGKADSLFTGYLVMKDNSKKVSFKTTFKNGCKEGEEVEYNDNGTIKYLRNFKNGKLDGLYKHLDEYGNIISQGFYKKGKKTDAWIEADPPRRISIYQNYKNDKLAGYTWTSYYANGKLFISGSYDSKDRKQGVFEIYSQDGDLISTETYRNGKLRGYLTSYYNGKAVKKTKFRQ